MIVEEVRNTMKSHDNSYFEVFLLALNLNLDEKSESSQVSSKIRYLA